MKKMIGLLLSIVMVLSMISAVSFGSGAVSARDAGPANVGAEKTYVCGDSDSNGKVTVLDVATIQRYLVDLPVDDFVKRASDADGDRVVTIVDATAIQRHLASMDTYENIGQEVPFDADVTITLFNSIYGTQELMEEMAAKYWARTGVDIQVYYSDEWSTGHLTERYGSGNPYTISLVDRRDVVEFAPEYGADLSDQDWVKDTDYAAVIDGKVYGCPFCLEARGLIYNADAVKRAAGKDFDPDAVKTVADFQALIDACVAGGLTDPTGVMYESWSLGAHIFPEVYEFHDDPDAFINGIRDGSVKLAEDEIFNTVMDAFDILKNNNYAKADPFFTRRDVTEQKLAEGDIAFLFGGNWDWSILCEYETADELGLMPLPGTGKLAGDSSKFFFIDSTEHTTDAQRQAAEDFLNWLVYSADGQDFIVNKMEKIPAFSNIDLPLSDPLGASVKKYADRGDMITPCYNLPDDHYARVGASFQMYLGGTIDREAFADEVTAYWKTADFGDN